MKKKSDLLTKIKEDMEQRKVVEELDRLIEEWPSLSTDEQKRTRNTILFDLHLLSIEDYELCLNKLVKAKIIKKGEASRRLKEEASRRPKEEKNKNPQTVLSANFPGLIDIATDDNGTIGYLVNTAGGLQSVPRWEIDGIQHIPPGRDKLPFSLPQASEVLNWYVIDRDCQLFDDLITYLKRFSYLPDDLWVIAACEVLLTYVQDHPDIQYLPELLFWGAGERGKSRTGKAICYASYRGIHLTDLRPANLFRFSQDMHATLFFDCKDLWRKAERSESEDILLSRFEKGAKVTRVLYPERGAFNDMVHYDIYGPTIIATNERVDKLLDSRCILITPPNRPSGYEKAIPKKAQELKERLTAWRARVIDKPLPEIEPIQRLEGRLWDISEPLLQVCKLTHPERMDTLVGALLEVAEQRIEDKKGSTEGKIIASLFELSPKKENISEWVILISELLNSLNTDIPEKYRFSSPGLGKRLKAMGIKTRKIHGYAEVLLTRIEFNILLVQYGIIPSPTPGETLPNSTKAQEVENQSLRR